MIYKNELKIVLYIFEPFVCKPLIEVRSKTKF